MKALIYLGVFLVITPLSVMLFIPDYLKFSFGIQAIGLIILSGVLLKRFAVNKKLKIDAKKSNI
jgi:hypothetical protein